MTHSLTSHRHLNKETLSFIVFVYGTTLSVMPVFECATGFENDMLVRELKYN